MSKYQEALERLGAEKLARGELIRNDSKVEPYLLILQELVDKETKYQVLEEELGIDLLTLFKVLKDGIEVGNDKMRVSVKGCKLVYREEDNEYAFIYDYYLIKLKDYGKYWWLEKPKEKEDD